MTSEIIKHLNNTESDAKRKRRLPHAIIIGSPKCGNDSISLKKKTENHYRTVYKIGTGGLIEFLSIHPRICSKRQTEMHFFDMFQRYKLGLEWYR